MKLAGMIGTAVLTVSLGIGIPAYAQQEQHDQQEEKAKPSQEQNKEKKAQPEKQAKPADKNARPQEKNASPKEKNAPKEKSQNEGKSSQQRSAPETKPAKNQHTAGNGRIPDDRFKANFGREHSFRVSEGDYRNRRFQYGGYWFGFNSAWPSNWLYTQDVYVVEIDGVYYLCNTNYPGVNLVLSVTL